MLCCMDASHQIRGVVKDVEKACALTQKVSYHLWDKDLAHGKMLMHSSRDRVLLEACHNVTLEEDAKEQDGVLKKVLSDVNFSFVKFDGSAKGW